VTDHARLERAAAVAAPFRKALLAWYRRTARDLPWRRTKDPYAVWLAEIILQQTRVDQGTPYYERFLEAFPTVEALAGASDDEVLKHWEGLGYYARARNLHACARRVVSDRGGRFPETAAGLRALPGIGPYTAAAIAGIAFGEPVAVVDGNVIRVLTRLFDIDAPVEDAAVRKLLDALADALVSPRSPGDHNQAMMELGACVCTPRTPDCPACPVAKWCAASAAGRQHARPVRRPKKPTPLHEVVAAVIRRDGAYLLGKRPPEGLLGGLWEFPGGKVQPGETHAQALQRELREELGVDVAPGKLIASVNHAYTHFRVRLHVYACTIVSGEPVAHVHAELRWVAKDDFPKYAFPTANRKFLDLV